jgi:spore coat protein U-like protein
MRWAFWFAALVLLAPATARAACTVTATPVTFGVYIPFSGVATNSTGSVTVHCNGAYTNPYRIALNAGLNSGGGSFANRRMKSGVSFLSYQLYTDAAHTIIWGDGTGGSVVVSVSCTGNCTKTQTVYGRIPALQGVAPGGYVDTTTVTVSF